MQYSLRTRDFHTKPDQCKHYLEYQKGRTIRDFNKARDDAVAVASAGPYANHFSRQITTSVPHPSLFYRPDALPAAQPTVSKH